MFTARMKNSPECTLSLRALINVVYVVQRDNYNWLKKKKGLTLGAVFIASIHLYSWWRDWIPWWISSLLFIPVSQNSFDLSLFSVFFFFCPFETDFYFVISKFYLFFLAVFPFWNFFLKDFFFSIESHQPRKHDILKSAFLVNSVESFFVFVFVFFPQKWRVYQDFQLQHSEFAPFRMIWSTAASYRQEACYLTPYNVLWWSCL